LISFRSTEKSKTDLTKEALDRLLHWLDRLSKTRIH
jgi:hypothetical protein